MYLQQTCTGTLQLLKIIIAAETSERNTSIVSAILVLVRLIIICLYSGYHLLRYL